MTPAEAIKTIHEYAEAWRLELTVHARSRMFERAVTYADLRHALMVAKTCIEQEAGKWKVSGQDLEGVELSAVVVVEEDLLVVTVF